MLLGCPEDLIDAESTMSQVMGRCGQFYYIASRIHKLR